MSESQEFNAATVEEAVSKASEKLGVPAPKLDYDVLDDGSPGFLGIGARDARITVSPVKPDPEGPSVEEPLDTPESNPTETAAGEEEIAQISQDESRTDEPKNLATVPVTEDLLTSVKSYTEEALEKMGFDARVDVYDTEGFVAVDVSPEDPGLFIGQKGETIDAFQHLINISVYKEREFSKRIVLDSEGYRQRRIEAVEGMAHRMARRATREGRDIQLPPMNSSERKIVHTYLKDDPRVETVSEGNGSSRRVSISPS